MTKEQINKYLTNRAVDKMTEYLMQDYNISIEQALDFIYNSDTYQKLNDKETGLYVESPAYIYQLLDREYKTGVLHNTQYLTQLPHVRKFLPFSDLTKGKLIYFASFAHY